MKITLLWSESIIRQAMADLLERHGRHQVVRTTSDPRQALEAMRSEQAHVLLAELVGIDPAQRNFLLGAKMLGHFGLIFVGNSDQLTANADEEMTSLSLELPRDEFLDQLTQMGDAYITTIDGRGRRKRDKPYGLAQREYEIASLIAKGHSNRRISEITGIQEQSVKNSVSTILRKLGCENRTQVALRLLT
jgi:DNA-binding NarL/FixJ family response regulator